MEKAPEQIKTWVASRGLKMGWLAESIPVGKSDLSRWVNGHAVPIKIYRTRLSEITGLEVSDEKCWK